jgi:hypothetical protein
MIEKLKDFAISSANIMFDDSKNDIRGLPKTVRLQILIVLSFVWSTVFSLYVFSLTSFIWGWARRSHVSCRANFCNLHYF